MANIHPGTVEEVYKIASINLSPNIVGQLAMSCMVAPPTGAEPSAASHQGERDAEIASLRRRAHMVTDGFNALEGVTCKFTEGAMYSFPQIRLPPKAMAAAKAAGKAPDVFYCLKLVEQTGEWVHWGSWRSRGVGVVLIHTALARGFLRLTQNPQLRSLISSQSAVCFNVLVPIVDLVVPRSVDPSRWWLAYVLVGNPPCNFN